jgi:Arginase family
MLRRARGGDWLLSFLSSLVSTVRTRTSLAGYVFDYSSLLADAVAAVLDEEEFPVVLGGDCSILLGAMLALRRRGRYGLLYSPGTTGYPHSAWLSPLAVRWAFR